MADDNKKIGDKKIGRVDLTKQSADVDKTGAVGTVDSIKSTAGVGAVGSTSSINKRKGTRVMSIAEREQIFDMINEEADKLFGSGSPLASQKDVLKKAVKMAVDSGLIDEEKDK
jgi:hypothetical protein